MYTSIAKTVLISYTVGFALAAPAGSITSCPVSNDMIPVPPGQTALTVPSGLKLIAIALGVGTQNYTCSNAGNFTSIGAVANLYDISCYENAILSSPVASDAAISVENVPKALENAPPLLGHHYFVKNPTGIASLSPRFDFRADSEKNNQDAFVIASKIGDIPAPEDASSNVDWLYLKAIPGQGQLATAIFRIDTSGGQAPTSCIPGSPPITVAYDAEYWFYK